MSHDHRGGGIQVTVDLTLALGVLLTVCCSWVSLTTVIRARRDPTWMTANVHLGLGCAGVFCLAALAMGAVLIARERGGHRP